MKKWNKIEIFADDFSFKELSSNETEILSDKYFDVDNYSNNKSYDGKVKSRFF